MRGARKIQVGKVVSNKMEKTVIVEVCRSFRHEVYGKIVRRKKKYYAHDEQSHQRQVGEKVAVQECRPLSKLKRWRVVSLG